LKSQNTRKRWYSFQYAEIQCHPEMQMRRVVVAKGWEGKPKNLNPHEEIEVEEPRLILLHHKG